MSEAVADAPRVSAAPSGAAAARLIALLLPLGLLAGAFGSQYLGGLSPCEMCWWQRYPHMVAIVLAALAFAGPAEASRSRGLTLLAALAIAVSGAIGVYHAGVELKIFEGFTTCTATASGGSSADLLRQITASPLVRCDQVQWSFLGISMAGWNAILSLGGAALITLIAVPTAHRCCASTRPANMARRESMPASSPCSAAIAPKPS
jgi:disulfide bond formation protein DsbB